jgi:AraC-like DNA-binding protein
MPTVSRSVRIKTVEFGFHGGRGKPKPMPVADQHNEIEINLVEKGGMVFRRGTETVSLAAGKGAIYWAAVPHQIVTVQPGTQISWIVLPLAWFLSWGLKEKFLRRVLEGGILPLSPANLSPVPPIENWAQDLFRPELRHAVRLEIEACFHRLAAGYASSATPRPQRTHEIRHVEAMVRLMTERFRDDLSVAEIAGSVNLTAEYAMRIFRQQWGVTLWTFLLQQRTAEARRLLVLDDAPLTEVGFACGFQSLGRFYHAFKLHCGCSPGAYRKRHRQTSGRSG